jgi:repressor LexA
MRRATLGMTRRQQQALSFIDGYIAMFGWSPSYQEIADAIGLRSKGRVFELVHALEARGYLCSHPRLHRSIKILPQESEHEQTHQNPPSAE